MRLNLTNPAKDGHNGDREMTNSTFTRYTLEWWEYVFWMALFWFCVILMHLMAIAFLPVWQVWYFYAAVWGAISHIKWVVAKAREFKRITTAQIMADGE